MYIHTHTHTHGRDHLRPPQLTHTCIYIHTNTHTHTQTVETIYVLPGSTVAIKFPPGAWPLTETRPVKISTLVPVPGSRLLLALLLKSGRRAGETRRLAGPVVSFEPSGVQFNKPVVITVPFNKDADYGNLVLAVHVYVNGV